MSAARIRRPLPYCVPPRPAQEMSARGIAIVVAIYVALFAAAALWTWG